MKNRHLQQGLAWRDDYRCARPPVSCNGCDTFYPPEKDTAVMVFEGFNLVRCSECKKPKGTRKRTRQTEPEILFPHVYKRVFRDVATRYIQRFGGSTVSVQTAADDCEIYLRNRYGLTIATVSLLNRFPERVDTAIFDDMPY